MLEVCLVSLDLQRSLWLSSAGLIVVLPPGRCWAILPSPCNTHASLHDVTNVSRPRHRGLNPKLPHTPAISVGILLLSGLLCCHSVSSCRRHHDQKPTHSPFKLRSTQILAHHVYSAASLIYNAGFATPVLMSCWDMCVVRFRGCASCVVKLCVFENRDGWLVSWALCESMLIRYSAVLFLPFTLL